MTEQQPVDPTPRPIPVFISGILQRSGTNFLQDLLLLHADCCTGGIFEDYLIPSSPLLMQFLSTLTESWDPNWFTEPRSAIRRKLGHALGRALLKFFCDDRQVARYLVMKTPSTLHLQSVFELFPTARVLVIVRDGRDVVESGIRTFGWNWECAVRQWRDSAARILTSLAHPSVGSRTLLIRYEDLLADTPREMTRIIEFLGLEPARYDFTATDRLAVRGSCEFGRRTGCNVGWEPVPRTAVFAPVGRHRVWTARKQQRFAWLAGEASHQLGYAVEPTAAAGTLYALLDWSQDLRWAVRAGSRRFRFLVRRALTLSEPSFTTGLSHYYERPLSRGERSPSLLPDRPSLNGGAAVAKDNQAPSPQSLHQR